MIIWLYLFYVQFYCIFKILKIISSEFLFSLTISWLVLFSTRIFVQIPPSTIQRGTIEELYCISKDCAGIISKKCCQKCNLTINVVCVAAGIRINPTMSFGSVISEFSSLTKSWTSPCEFSKITCSKEQKCVSPLKLWKYSVRILRDGNLIE